MNYEERCQLAFDELQAAGIMKSGACPPLWKLATRCGFQPRPPHYNSFLYNTLSFGVYFGFFWGLSMYLLVWRTQPGSWLVYASGALLAGALFGLCMAAHLHHGFKKNKLTPWEKLSVNHQALADTAAP